jgi:hypothetical protein
LEDEITHSLLDLRAEIELVRFQLNGQDVPLELTTPGFERLRDTASATYLNQSWNGLRSNIAAPECRYAFLFANWILRNQPNDSISDEDLQSLSSTLHELEERISQAQISSALLSFMMKQVNSLKKALRSAKIRGAGSVRDSLSAVLGDLHMQSEILSKDIAAAEKDNPGLVTDFVTAIKTTGDVCDAGVKIMGFVSMAQPILQKLLG